MRKLPDGVKLTGFGMGHYRVALDGEHIGAVFEKVTRYNLRRVIVSRSWIARAADDTRIPATGGGYSTRHDAIEVLVRHVSATPAQCPACGRDEGDAESPACPSCEDYEEVA